MCEKNTRAKVLGLPFLPVFPRQPTFQKFPRGPISQAEPSASAGPQGCVSHTPSGAAAQAPQKQGILGPLQKRTCSDIWLRADSAGHKAKHFTCIHSSNPFNNPKGRNYYYPHFTNGSNKDQRNEPGGWGGQRLGPPPLGQKVGPCQEGGMWAGGLGREMGDGRELRQDWMWNVTNMKETAWLKLSVGPGKQWEGKSGKKWGSQCWGHDSHCEDSG